MAWVSPRVYAILSKSEEGKDIIERLPDMTQNECSQELDKFFGKGGKGYKSNAEYSQAKFDDEAEEERYKLMGDEEVAKHEDSGEESKAEKIAMDIDEYINKQSLNTIKRYCEKYGEDYDYVIGELAKDIAAGALEDNTEQEVVETLLDNLVFGKEKDWKTTKMASGTIHELGDKRIIEEENEKGDTQYRINGTNGQVFSSLEEAKNAFNEEYKVGDEVEVQGKEYTITKIDENGNFEAEGKNGTFGRGNLKDKTGFGGNPISIKKINRMNNNVEASNPKKLDDIIKERNTFTKDKDYDAYSFKKELEKNGHKVEYIENRSGTWQDKNGEKFKEYDIKLEDGQHIYFRLIADENYDTKEIIAYKNGKNW